MSDYSELKKRAMDATPGPWYEQDDEDSAAGAVFIMPTSDVWAPPICRITTEANAAYVAAANPSVILELIEDNERLGLELKDFQWGASVEAEAADEARTEVSKLRAENAGLRTGYQAYERVSAELKAEVEKVDSDRKACWAEFKVQGRYIDQLKDENDALRKDAERYRSLRKATPYRFKKMQDAALTDGGDVMYFHADRFDAAIDAAMAQGEQP